MSGDRKRTEPYELTRVVHKKPRLESPDQEITVHPYDDDFFGSDNESTDRTVSGKFGTSCTQQTTFTIVAIYSYIVYV